MPTYEYLCKSCGDRLEVQQRFTDAALTECPRCEGPLRKVFGNVGIAFKGSGFYKTDSRSSSSASKTASTTGDTSKSSESSSTSTSSDSTSSSASPSTTTSSTVASSTS